ncbi:hypothetical protein FACS1894103_7130 [Campylobacterota bacterium]|nr:hypothetical protein FACS1894103_7130 [Campylobacterota bacterium]
MEIVIAISLAVALLVAFVIFGLVLALSKLKHLFASKSIEKSHLQYSIFRK